MSQLHILNGDSSKHCLDALHISGDVAVWREMLSDGPVVESVASEAFWATRALFFETTSSVSAAKYFQLTRDEFSKITAFNQFDETVLWFEYDLFCQINLMALCSFLHRHRQQNSRISLICVGNSQQSEQLLGLGEFPEDELRIAYENRIELTAADLQFADDIWQLYCQPDPADLAKKINIPHPTFNYLRDAFAAHFHRFPGKFNGLNSIENKILTLLFNEPKSANQIVGELLRWQTWFGFGDLQYFAYLDQLKSLYEIVDDTIHITDFGKKVLGGETSFLTVNQPEYYFGGAVKQHFFAEDLTTV